MRRITFLSVLLLLLVLAAALINPSVRAQADAVCAADVIVGPGDTLSAIAGRVLGDSAGYDRLVAATNAAAERDASYASIQNPAAIAVGWKLCVPGEGALPVAASTPPATPSAESAAAEGDDPPPAVDGEKLTIDHLRSLSFPGSEVTIEEELAVGANYRRYLASYRSEGLTIDALLTVPNGEPPASGWPVIVFNHGYIPPEVYRTTERYVAYVDGFARSGYIVFKPDYRGHGFSEGEPASAYGFPDYAIDVLNAVATMKRYPQADSERIGLWGHSMGGYLTLRSMVTDPDIKAGVIWAGVVASYPDLLERWNRRTTVIPERARRWRQQLLDEYGTPDENPEFWASISANSYLAELSGPIQLHHGTADASVPVAFSEVLADEITAAGGTVELYRYEGDDHNLAGEFSTAMARSVAFFDTHLKGQ